MTGQWQPPQQLPNPQPVHRAPSRPWWKTRWAIIAAAVIAAFLLIGIGAAGGTQHTVAGPTTHETTTATATVNATVTATPTVVRTTQQVLRTTTTQQVVKVVATRTRVQTVTYTPPPPKQFGEGTYVVGTDIQPGTYHSAGGSLCYWARLSSLSTQDIVDNSNSTGPQTVQVQSSDKAFQVMGSCTFGKA